MKEKKMLRALGNVDNQFIKEAEPTNKSIRKVTWTKWAAVVACFCFVLFGTLVYPGISNEKSRDISQVGDPTGTDSIPSGIAGSTVQPESNNVLYVNEVASVAAADMDVQIFVYNFDDISLDERTKVETEFEKVVGNSYDSFITMMPDTLTVTSFYSVNTRVDASKKEYSPHDYVFECDTETGGQVRLAVSSLGPTCRDVFIVSDNPTKSQIKGSDLTIYGWNGMYFVEFFSDGRFYDIETTDFTLAELKNLLVSIVD